MAKKNESNTERVKRELLIRYHYHKNVPNLERIVKTFISVNNIEDVFSDSRFETTVSWRNSLMMIFILNGYTLTATGKFFGRHHSTVIHASKIFIDELEGFGGSMTEKIRDFLLYVSTRMTVEKGNVRSRKERVIEFMTEVIKNSPELNIGKNPKERENFLNTPENKFLLSDLISKTIDYYEFIRQTEGDGTE